jgi:hypothetical protein
MMQLEIELEAQKAENIVQKETIEHLRSELQETVKSTVASRLIVDRSQTNLEDELADAERSFNTTFKSKVRLTFVSIELIDDTDCIQDSSVIGIKTSILTSLSRPYSTMQPRRHLDSSSDAEQIKARNNLNAYLISMISARYLKNRNGVDKSMEEGLLYAPISLTGKRHTTIPASYTPCASPAFLTRGTALALFIGGLSLFIGIYLSRESASPFTKINRSWIGNSREGLAGPGFGDYSEFSSHYI